MIISDPELLAILKGAEALARDIVARHPDLFPDWADGVPLPASTEDIHTAARRHTYARPAPTTPGTDGACLSSRAQAPQRDSRAGAPSYPVAESTVVPTAFASAQARRGGRAAPDSVAARPASHTDHATGEAR